MRTLLFLSTLLVLIRPVTAQDAGPSASSDSAAAVETVDRFHEALPERDSSTVAMLLRDDAVILEGGGLETKVEYFNHHFGADATFLKNLQRTTHRRQVRTEGGTAWVSTTSRLRGSYRGETVDLSSAELMVLRETPDGWRIAAIHWSSRSRE